MSIRSLFVMVPLLVAITAGLAQPACAGRLMDKAPTGKHKPVTIAVPGGKLFKSKAEKMVKPKLVEFDKGEIFKSKAEKMVKPKKVEFEMREIVKPKGFHKAH